MGESEKHKKLKHYARMMLMSMGFEDDEIYEEYGVSFKGHQEGSFSKKSYIIDVCGISKTINGRSIAIECGHSDATKLVQIKPFFDEVIHLPYDVTFEVDKSYEVIDKFKKRIKDLETDLYESEKTINKLNTKISYLETFKEKFEKYYPLLRLIAAIFYDENETYILNNDVRYKIMNEAEKYFKEFFEE